MIAAERVVTAVLLGLVAFAVLANALLLCGANVPPFLLPIALATGALAERSARRDPPTQLVPTLPPRWLPPTLLVILAAASGAVGYGALATSSRHWDGAVAWDLRAAALTAAPTLQQPFFAEGAVLSPAIDYPLLQPLLVASGNALLGGDVGRVWFPALYLLFGALVATTLRRGTGNPTLAWLGTAAAMLTPALVSPKSGAVDSGYGDAFVLLCTTSIAAGVWRRDPRLVFAGTALAIATKPEGLPYAGVTILVTFATDERQSLRAAVAGFVITAATWLPLQRLLTKNDPSTPMLVGAVALFASAIVAIDEGLRRWWPKPRVRFATAALFAASCIALALVTWRSSAGGTMNAYVGDLGRPLHLLAQAPRIVVAAVDFAFLRGGFLLAFWFAAVAFVVAAHRRGLRPLRPLWWFAASGCCLVLAPFLASPEADLAHHLRSSMPRLLLHWVGPALLLGCACVAATTTPADRPADAPAP